MRAQPDYAGAFELLKQAADRGLPRAQRALAELYRDGLGVQKNMEEAVVWFRRSANGGDGRAQAILAGLYGSGQGVERNEKESVKWYKKSAESGDSLGQLSLGILYANGRGVRQDALAALKWYRLSAEQGVPLAQFALGSLYEKGFGKVRPDPAEAVLWYTRALQQGFEGARAPLAAMRNVHVLPEADGRARLTSRLQLQEAALARAARISGDVALRLQVDIQGKVTGVDVLSGHPLLLESAAATARTLQFTPYVVSGQPVPFVTSMTLQYAY